MLWTYRYLSAPIRDNLQALNQENTYFPGNYDFDIIITPSRRIQYSNGLMFDEQSYLTLLESVNRCTAEGCAKKDLEEALVGDIKDYYNRVLNNFNLKQINLHEMYKAVDQEIVDFTMEAMQTACNALGLQTTQKNILVMAFHIKFLLDRLRNKKTVPGDKKVQRSEIKREHARELEAAQQIVESIEIRFGSSVPSDEKYFIALMLAGIDSNEHTDAPRLYIIAHGNSTATSIADVCNRLMDCGEAKGIDAPLEQSVEDTYRNFLSALQANPPQKGAIVLADMGSLVQMGERAMSETGIPIYTLPNVTTLMALDITRMLCKADDVHTIYREYMEKIQPVLQASVRGTAILTVCATGAGTSEAFKAMIHEELARTGLEGIHLESLNYNEVKERSTRYCQLTRDYNVLAYVGNIDCGLKIPFFHVTKLLSDEGKLNFIKYVGGLAAQQRYPAETPADEIELLKQECCRFLKKNLVYLNPEIAARYALKYIDAIGLPQLADNRPLKLSLMLHMGFMLERNIVTKKIIFDGEEEFINDHKSLYDILRKGMPVLEEFFNITINDAEICYIIQTLQKSE